MLPIAIVTSFRSRDIGRGDHPQLVPKMQDARSAVFIPACCLPGEISVWCWKKSGAVVLLYFSNFVEIIGSPWRNLTNSRAGSQLRFRCVICPLALVLFAIPAPPLQRTSAVFEPSSLWNRILRSHLTPQTSLALGWVVPYLPEFA
jgi:hypothetical protein